MLLKDMSRHTKEAHADSLMKLSTSLFTALLAALFIAPLLAIIKNSEQNNQSFLLDFLMGKNGILFMTFEFVTIALSIWAKEKALIIYNELYPDIQPES